MPLTKKNVTNNGGSFEMPTLIKTVAGNQDYVLMVDGSGTSYKILKADLLAGLSSSGSGSSGNDPYFSNVVLLMPFSGANGSTTFTDIKRNAITFSGSTAITTSVLRYGNGVLSLPGNGGQINIAANPLLTLTTDFTIEFDIQGSSQSHPYPVLFGESDIGFASPQFYINFDHSDSRNKLSVHPYPSGSLVSSKDVTDGSWHKVAVCRNSGVIRLFIDGDLQASTLSYTASINYGNGICIGRNINDGGDIYTPSQCYLANLRISDICRYTANYTVASFSDPTT